ncbi:MAG TPA: DNA mismatch repair endonuclease MutL, partial [Clostridiales bacterium]|nr:DNA mismatch repair endonuclease MutL [Clostridiales bacterium]
MAKIHLLDNETINKIAAGEVIESPKSIVKELVENSIDAGADEITVEIKNGGKSLIRITDNGKGIEKDEVEDAFKRHCTSKISTSDDLNSLYTLGFRGEALASIASVSHVELITRTAEDSYGTKITLTGGEIVSKEDIGCPVGTIMTVTDLFFNVPARKKFLKSDASESGNINEIVLSLALSKENISFKYINNGNVIFRTPKSNNFLNTISSLYEKDMYNSLLKVNYENNGIIVTGYTTNLNYYRGNRKQQIIFVNSRLIKHKRINYFIEAAYNTLLPKNKYPACFLKIEIDPSLVDVNVHPAKTEVRFQNEDNK